MWNPFKRKPKASAPQIDPEHEELRRAIERCDALKPAFDAGQLKLDDVVATLERNAFPEAVVRKAIAESLGEDAARKLR